MELFAIEDQGQQITCKRTVSIPGRNHDFHLHDFYEIYLFLAGDVRYFVEQAIYPLRRGDLLIFDNREIHRAAFLSQAPYERVVIHFSYQLGERLSTPRTSLIECFSNREPGQDNLIHLPEEELERFLSLSGRLEALCASPEPGADVLSNAVLSEILVWLAGQFRTCSSRPAGARLSDKVLEVVQYINSHIDSDLSLERLEQQFALSRFYLGRLFREETGSTLHQYIQLKRIAQAKRLLLSGHSVTDTCTLSGFNDYSHFIRTFRSVTGYTPYGYYKNSRRG